MIEYPIMKLPLPLTASTYNTHLSNWLDVLKRSEVCTVLFAPIIGRPNRISNLESILQSQGKKLAVLEFPKGVNIDTHIIEDTFNDPEVYAVVVMFAERFLQPHFGLILESILLQQITTGKGVLFFFDTFWYEIESSYLKSYSNLFQNVDYFPIFSEADSKQFMKYLGVKWQIKLSKEQISILWTYTNGQPWLIKEAIRQLSKGSDINQIFHSNMYQFKTTEIWNVLDSRAKVVLQKTLETQIIGTDVISSSLQQMGYISEQFPQLIPTFLINAIKALPKATLVLEGDELLIDNQLSNDKFTKLELRFLTHLVKSKTKILSREQMASICWPEANDTGYSDWALDQIVKRVRKKLKQLGISPQSVKTFKAKGYSFKYE